MEKKDIANLIKKSYNLEVKSVEKIKNTYKINAKEGKYCIKVIKYDFPHFYFILSAVLHLQRRGFNTIPEILKSTEGEYYIKFFGNYAYLTKWICARESDFDNPIELEKISQKLGELHKCSEGFSLTKDMKPRIGWFSWIDVFHTRRNEILDFKNRINQKAHKTKFDNLYLSVMGEEIDRADRSIKALKGSNYIDVMEKEMLKRGFCHHDYANHNILFDEEGQIYLIDFDYCIMDSHIHDLSSLMIRAMKNGNWNLKKGQSIIKNYSKIKNVHEEELGLMKEFIRFPQMFWQLGIQMYWEQQPWEEDFFLSRLSKYIEDREERGVFIEEFFHS